MTRILVSTVGNAMFLDPNNGTVVRHIGYTVVERTPFIQQKIGNGIELKLEKLPDGFTDEHWLEQLASADGDEELAIATLGEPSPKPKGRKAAE